MQTIRENSVYMDVMKSAEKSKFLRDQSIGMLDYGHMVLESPDLDGPG